MMTVAILVASLVFTTVVNSHDDDRSWRHSEKVKGLFKDQYDRLVRPSVVGKGPVNVNLTMFISQAKWSDNKLGVIFYLRQFWNDPRLAVQDPKTPDLPLNADEIIPYIWKPDTFFQEQLKVKDLNSGFLRVKSNGDITWSQMIKLKTPCVLTPVMIYENDGRLNCTFSLASYSFTTEDIKYNWGQGSTDPNNAVRFEMNDLVTGISTSESPAITATGKYDSMKVQLELQTKFTKEVMRFMAAKLIAKFEI